MRFCIVTIEKSDILSHFRPPWTITGVICDRLLWWNAPIDERWDPALLTYSVIEFRNLQYISQTWIGQFKCTWKSGFFLSVRKKCIQLTPQQHKHFDLMSFPLTTQHETCLAPEMPNYSSCTFLCGHLIPHLNWFWYAK